jgi:SAM-dependent MidA family methyltransferase
MTQLPDGSLPANHPQVSHLQSSHLQSSHLQSSHLQSSHLQSSHLQSSQPQLMAILGDRFTHAPDQRLTFAEFMDLALYHPQYGYYTTNQSGAGIQQDFFTSAHLGADFGELLAVQFVQLWEELGAPAEFTLVEMGAGQGLLVQDILRYLHRHHYNCFEALNYVIVERSPALVATQQQRFQPFADKWGKLSWKMWEEIPSRSVIGCFFSNELVDAFPVHRVAIAHSDAAAPKLKLVYVTFDPSGQLVEVLDDPAADLLQALTAYFELVEIDWRSLPDGYRTEVNLAALDWMQCVSDRLQRGYVLTIDYGYPAARYYSPTRREGTLQCYAQHAYHSDPYVAVGRQDITAHVDFTALSKQGDRCGLQTIGWTQQAMFLMALGLGDRLMAIGQTDPGASIPELSIPELSIPEILQRRQTLHGLIDPSGLGNFEVLLQGKGLTEAERGRSPQILGFRLI